jgi:flagellar hook-associated protein 3 FlgL
MIDSLSASDATFLRSLTKIQQRLERAQREVASGRRVFSASDAPDGVSALLATRAELSANEQLRKNLGRTKAEVDAAENGLQQAIRVMERARTLAAQGQNGFNVESTWKALALEAGDLLQQMLNVSNLAVEGRFVFAGNNDSVQPFDYDAGLETVTAYAGSAATKQSLFPGGNPFPVARSGEEIFDNPGVDSNGVSKSAFAALRQLRDALTARDESGMRDALQAIEASAKNLSNELSFYGATQRRVDEAMASADAATLRLQTQLSRLEDADLTVAILESQQAQFQLEAAFRVRAQRPRQSLFDFLG